MPRYESNSVALHQSVSPEEIGPGETAVLTDCGKHAEKRLEDLQRRREQYQGLNLTRLNGADTRDRLDEQIDAIEARFAENSPLYWKIVRHHARRGTHGVRSYVRRR